MLYYVVVKTWHLEERLCLPFYHRTEKRTEKQEPQKIDNPPFFSFCNSLPNKHPLSQCLQTELQQLGHAKRRKHSGLWKYIYSSLAKKNTLIFSNRTVTQFCQYCEGILHILGLIIYQVNSDLQKYIELKRFLQIYVNKSLL